MGWEICVREIVLENGGGESGEGDMEREKDRDGGLESGVGAIGGEMR